MESDLQIIPKVSGYLEKKGRKKMMSCYKKYWFVLEGRLLLYYKSKDEYDAISPCKGSINLGPTCNVKPCTSNIGVFQIESKTTTITLRAETREEQHKWMQAIMSALNQNNGSKRLSHFRYSLGEIGELTSSQKKPLERQKTFPERFVNTSPKPNKKIIEKLQKIGAHSYGIGPKLQRSKTTLERQKQMSYSDETLTTTGKLKKELSFRTSESVITENEEYGLLDSKRGGNSVESVNASSDGLYEKIPSTGSVFITKENEIENLKSILVSDTKYISTERNKSSTSEEYIYSEPGEILKNNETTIMTDNDTYWDRKNKSLENIDYNENKVKEQIRKHSLSSKGQENVYSEANYEINRNTGNSAEYADIAQYAEISPRNSSMSSQGSNEDKEKKKFKGFGKKNKNQKEKPVEKQTKLKKSESFLQRVWLKKTKNKRNKKEISLSDGNVLENLDVPEEDTIKMLNALQDILEAKKSDIKKLHITEEVTDSVKDQENNMIYQEVLVDENNIDKDQSKNVPLLPPRNIKQKGFSPYHDVPKPQPPAVPPKIKRNVDSVLLDDILDDLDKQSEYLKRDLPDENENDNSQNGEGKVKALIKRFSIGKEEGVELRKKNNLKVNSESYCTDSRELDILLDELAKVTTAPIMTPGVTTSLINPEVSDAELLKMIPKQRRRRSSEPDYDIPRPHRSLTNIPKKDDNALEATRFFGPILKPSDFETPLANRPPTPVADYYSNLPSITPDSLEVECPKSDLSHDENRNISYHSHDYLSFNKRSHNNLDFLVENHIYADPRFLYKSRNDYPGMYNQRNNFPRIEDSDNVFVDSLES